MKEGVFRETNVITVFYVVDLLYKSGLTFVIGDDLEHQKLLQATVSMWCAVILSTAASPPIFVKKCRVPYLGDF